jgi:hypothetical protein
MQVLELCRLVLVRLIALQSALERTIGREELERRDGTLDCRVLKKNSMLRTCVRKKKTKIKIKNKH